MTGKWKAYCPVCGEEMEAATDPALSPSYCDAHADDDDMDENWDNDDDYDEDDENDEDEA